MHNDSIETLLQRHYGSNALTPVALEQRLLSSVRQEARAIQRQQQARERRLSRRQVLRLVALGSAGVGIVSAGIEGLQQLETVLLGQDISQSAYS